MLYAQSSAARMIAASNNRCRAIVSADMFPTISPEMKAAYESMQGMQTKPCDHCGNPIPAKAFAGCGAHPKCEGCLENTSLQFRKPNGCCTIRGCNLPVPDQCIPLVALSEARAQAAECMHKMVFALQREEMTDATAAPAAAPTTPDADADPDSDGEPEAQQRRVGGKSGPWSEAKKADARAARARNAANKAKLECYDALLAENLAFKDEVEMLKSTVADLEARMRRYIHEVDDSEPDEPIDDSESDPEDEDEDEPMDEDVVPADAIKA
jgi:hypothetical protein